MSKHLDWFFKAVRIAGVNFPAVFFKIVVAYTRFKQPLFAPARVARAAPDLALPHR
jgi:hypothetical protein